MTDTYENLIRKLKRYQISFLVGGILLGVIAPEEVAGHGRGRELYYPPPPWAMVPFCPPGYGWPEYVWPPPAGMYFEYPRMRGPYPYREPLRHPLGRQAEPRTERFYEQEPFTPPQSRPYTEESPLSPYGYFDERGVWVPYSRPPEP